MRPPDGRISAIHPTEFAGVGDCPSCEHRPSHNTPEARRLRAFNITRLIRCGSSSFRPVGSLPGLLNPLQPRGWTGTWPFRREPPNSTGGTFTHERCTLRGLLRGGLFIACDAPRPLFFLLPTAIDLPKRSPNWAFLALLHAQQTSRIDRRRAQETGPESTRRPDSDQSFFETVNPPGEGADLR